MEDMYVDYNAWGKQTVFVKNCKSKKDAIEKIRDVSPDVEYIGFDIKKRYLSTAFVTLDKDV